jgi:hypothetical protein
MVTIEDNALDLRKGTVIGYVYTRPNWKVGYIAGGIRQPRTIALWIGVAFALGAVGLSAFNRSRRDPRFALWALAISVACLAFTYGGVWPLLSL